VVAVDLPRTFTSNPSLGAASDYIAVNVQPFYSSTTTALNAGAYVASQISVLSGVAAGKSVVVTEVGWPRNGNCNGVACPSTANQKVALDSVRATLSGRVIFYAAFDHRWNNEYWGLVGYYSF
jgi:exo-beta-1,3-glucanase (GH17 family)